MSRRKKKKKNKKKLNKEQDLQTEKELLLRKQMNEELHAIYVEKDGELPDLTKLERKEGMGLTRILIKLIVGLILISLVAWGGFLVWSQGLFQRGEVLETSIEGPSEVRAGEEVFFTIRYDNTGEIPLASLEMKLNLPFGFNMTSASPEPTQDQTWTIGSISPGSDGSIVVGGVFITEVPSKESVQAFFTYRPANFSSDFQDIVTKSIDINDSVISITISGPGKTLPGDEVEYIINAQNSSDALVKNIEVFADLSGDFTITSSEPELSEGDEPIWIIDEIEPGGLATITINGQFTSSVSGEQQISARASFKDDANVSLEQATSEIVTDILGGGLNFSLIVDGSTQDITADLDDRLRVSIDYANSGEDAISGFEITLTLSTPDGKALPIDWSEATLSGGTRSGQTITWNEDVIEEFETFNPATSGVIDLTLPIDASIDPSVTSDTFSMKLVGSMQKVGAVESPRSIEATPLSVAINSDMQASAEARYYTDEGEPLGTGPLPPTVGETTSYQVVWKITNSLHTLENVIFSTNLPSDVSWKDRTQKDIGEITYNETTRLVTWKIGKLPTEITEAEATFEVVIVPDEDDIGSFFKLINATSVSAGDSVSGGSISTAMDILSSELSTDEFAEGKGIVSE